MELNKEIHKIIINELLPRLNKRKLSIKDSPINEECLRFLAEMKINKFITHKILREYMDSKFNNLDNQ